MLSERVIAADCLLLMFRTFGLIGSVLWMHECLRVGRAAHVHMLPQ